MSSDMDKSVQWTNDITSSKGAYTIQVRSDKIHEIIKGSYMTTFFSNIKEENCYKISNFGLALYDAKIKHCSHKYKIIFAWNTAISPSPSLSVPIHGFNFTEFEKILASTLDESFHYDVIGLLVGKEDAISTFKKPKNKNIVRVTFWDDFAEILSKEEGIHSGDKIKAVILATIEHLDTLNGWYYIFCRKDKTKLTDM
ncbi:hypothetical protein V2J09_010132 [Rumex salicifolius]